MKDERVEAAAVALLEALAKLVDACAVYLNRKGS
jgi:hypothetical protein